MSFSRFSQVDVFTRQPCFGNPVAVVLDAATLTAADMQRIARWTNLSETTFVVPATDARADYRVRIFTPSSELPFAGHPTLGTAHALLEAGIISARNGELLQECGAGLIRLQVTDDDDGRWIAFDLPATTVSSLTDADGAELGSLLGAALSADVRPLLIDVGPRWIVAQLPDAEAVLALQPDLMRLKALSLAVGAVGVTVFGDYAPCEETRIEVRSFAPLHGINEDPVCGSGNGCVAAFLRETGQTARVGTTLLSSQGQVVGRAGRIRLSLAPDRITVGGQSVTCVNGRLRYE